MRVRLWAAALLAALASLSGTLAQEAPASDPLLGERIVDGAASKARLWVRNDKGAVVAFDRATGERTVVARDGVIDLFRSGGVTAALRTAPGLPGRVVVTDLETGARLTPVVRTPAASLARAGADWIIFGKDAVLRSNGGPWRRQPYQPFDRRGFGVIVTEAAADGALYVGYNRGEWGGGLWRLAPGSDQATEIDGLPTNQVTAVISDPDRAGCVLAATGLSHMGMTLGAVLRACDGEAEKIFNRAAEPPADGSLRLFSGNTAPVFGLVPSAGGWTAVSQSQLFVSKNGEVTASAMPALKPWSTLWLAQTGDVILILTDVNWALSVSGYTPLLIPVRD